MEGYVDELEIELNNIKRKKKEYVEKLEMLEKEIVDQFSKLDPNSEKNISDIDEIVEKFFSSDQLLIFRKQKMKLERILVEKKKENEKLSGELEEKGKKIEKLESEVEQLKKKVDELQTEVQEFDVFATNQNEQLKTEIIKIESEKFKKEQTLKEIEEEKIRNTPTYDKFIEKRKKLTMDLKSFSKRDIYVNIITNIEKIDKAIFAKKLGLIFDPDERKTGIFITEKKESDLIDQTPLEQFFKLNENAVIFLIIISRKSEIEEPIYPLFFTSIVIGDDIEKWNLNSITNTIDILQNIETISIGNESDLKTEIEIINKLSNEPQLKFYLKPKVPLGFFFGNQLALNLDSLYQLSLKYGNEVFIIGKKDEIKLKQEWISFYFIFDENFVQNLLATLSMIHFPVRVFANEYKLELKVLWTFLRSSLRDNENAFDLKNKNLMIILTEIDHLKEAYLEYQLIKTKKDERNCPAVAFITVYDQDNEIPIIQKFYKFIQLKNEFFDIIKKPKLIDPPQKEFDISFNPINAFNALNRIEHPLTAQYDVKDRRTYFDLRDKIVKYYTGGIFGMLSTKKDLESCLI